MRYEDGAGSWLWASCDGTIGIMRQLVEDDSAAAAVAGSGLDSGSGARCRRRSHHPWITDLQDPPERIPKMMQAWKDGADVVCMRRRSRAGETWCKRYGAHNFYRVFNAISDVEILSDRGDFWRLFTLWVVGMALVLGNLVRSYSSLISMVTILGGAQLLLIGLLGDYIEKTSCETKQCVWCAMRCSSES